MVSHLIDCGGVLTETSGTLEPPQKTGEGSYDWWTMQYVEGPTGYAYGKDCAWMIKVSLAYKLAYKATLYPCGAFPGGHLPKELGHLLTSYISNMQKVGTLTHLQRTLAL